MESYASHSSRFSGERGLGISLPLSIDPELGNMSRERIVK